jgi:hypothetical protein
VSYRRGTSLLECYDLFATNYDRRRESAFMNDTIGLTYDDDAAAHFVSTTTGLDAATVERALRPRDRYHLGLGLLPHDAFDDVTPAQVRASAPRLFPPEYIARRYVAVPLERKFIMHETGLDEETVCRIQDADESYMRKRGIL